ncbi:unnamed protein product [Ceutorhynchus assimilis]|uniref:Hemimethylated DNA-binding domain-containing protein n=1 Tax=Ceutorhynchus assimilis TaxID=467358 RepID=A0A9P0DDC9_9CUCU|nr:unnamed protein product [Ceutorhynchus assimilis]
MERLPVELIEKISVDDGLSIQDAINLSLTCRRLQDAIRSNNGIWNIKFYQLNPLLKNKLEVPQESYYDELKHLYKVKKRIMIMLEDMSEKFYTVQELSHDDLKEWEDFVQEYCNNYFYIVQDLLEMSDGKFNPIESAGMIPFNTPGHLTQKYYALKVLRGIRQTYLSKMWRQYIAKPPEQCFLEEGATIMAEWFQCKRDSDFEEISWCLDDIADMVKKQVQITYPNSPLSQVCSEQLNAWRTSKIPDNDNWNFNDLCDVLKTIGQVLFHRLNFQISDQYEDFNCGDFFLNIALQTKRATLPLLAIIYDAVARRLGIRCEISMCSPLCFLWFCMIDEPVVYYYIDLSAEGKISRNAKCHIQIHNTREANHPPTPATNIIIFLVSHFRQLVVDYVTLRSTLEFQQVIDPNDHRIRNNLAALYLRLNISAVDLQNGDSRLVVFCERPNFRTHCPTDIYHTLLEPVKRPEYVQFAVGMVMKHKKFSYRCVIFNWDKECVASPTWISQNQIADLKYGTKQPFYNVIGEDYSHRYVAQENLMLCKDTNMPQDNGVLGRYFSHFHNTYFVPNRVTEKLFPHDGAIRRKFENELIWQSGL